MIGRGQIEIGARSDGLNDFLLGLTTGAETNDGGFSPDTTGANLIVKPGILMPPGPITDRSTNLSDEIIASAEDPAYLGDDRVFLDDSGNFYTYDSNTLTKEVTASSDKFTLGTTDFVAWNDTSGGLNFYATTSAGANGDIVKWNKSSTLVETWWTGAGTLNQAALSGLTPWRPLLVFEKNLYVGDKNKIHRILPDLTVSNGLVTLDPNESISALGIDNNTGYMLVAVTTGADYSALRNGRSKIYIYDGFSSKAIKAAETNGVITAIISVGSQTYVFYGNKMGIFTGSGIRFLRTLRFSIGTSGDLIYKHKVCVIDDTLYIAENAALTGSATTVLAYGPLWSGGPNVFYPVMSPDTSSEKFTMLCSVGENQLGFSYSSAQFYTHNITSVASVIAGGQAFRSKWYRFPRPVHLKEIRVDFETPIAAGSDNMGTVQIEDDTNTTTSIKTIAQDTALTLPYVVTPVIGKKVNAFRLKWTNSPATLSKIYGVRKFTVYYDGAE